MKLIVDHIRAYPNLGPMNVVAPRITIQPGSTIPAMPEVPTRVSLNLTEAQKRANGKKAAKLIENQKISKAALLLTAPSQQAPLRQATI